MHNAANNSTFHINLVFYAFLLLLFVVIVVNINSLLRSSMFTMYRGWASCDRCLLTRFFFAIKLNLQFRMRCCYINFVLIHISMNSIWIHVITCWSYRILCNVCGTPSLDSIRNWINGAVWGSGKLNHRPITWRFHFFFDFSISQLNR